MINSLAVILLHIYASLVQRTLVQEKYKRELNLEKMNAEYSWYAVKAQSLGTYTSILMM